MSRTHLARLLAAALPGAALALPARAQVAPLVVVERAPFVGDDVSLLETFGSAVAIDGDTAVVGALLADAPGVNDAGAAYVFVRSGTTWVQQAKLNAGDPAAGTSFGVSVAVQGNTIAVGASTDGEAGQAAGAVYVFFRTGTTWAQQQKVLAGDLAGLETFGGSVALQGDTLVAGAAFGSGVLPFSGAAYVFTRAQGVWSQQAKVFALDGVPLQAFGSSVALSGLTLLVGAPNDAGRGAAYAFVGAVSVWVQQAKLTATGGAAEDAFGSHVALDGDLALVGAPDDDDAGASSGSAFVFARAQTSWSQQAKLVAPGAGAGDRFGAKVALSGLRALVGASQDDDGGEDAGAAYLFERVPGASWALAKKLRASDGAAQHRFGEAVGLDGDRALAGAPLGGTGTGSGTGVAYVFDVLGPNGGDACSAARTIAGEGAVPFDLAGATPDGPAHAGCSFGGDLWYCWTAPCDGTVTVDTCGGTSVDTTLAVYDGCACPASAAALLDCDGDTCGAQSSVAFEAIAGSTYLIRVAGASLADAGAGTFRVEVDCDVVVPQCPFLTVTGGETVPSLSPLRFARTLRAVYGFRDGVLRGTTVGERWIELWYRHAPELDRILRERPALRREAALLVRELEPGFVALARGDASASELTVPPRALALFERVVDGLARADVAGELARDLAAERARIRPRELFGATYAEAWAGIRSR